MIVAVLCGVLYLVFDAVRSFVVQLSPVRLRRLTTESDESGRATWLSFDPHTFHLVSGALLQIALIVAVTSTILSMSNRDFGTACLTSVGIWAGIVLVWKFLLALIPDDLGELILRGLIPVTNISYYLFWPVLFPLRKIAARFDMGTQTEEDEEEVTDEQVQAYIDVGEEEGILEAGEGRMLQQIVDFGDTLARELMTPRIDVLAFPARKSIEELARIFSESKYSRIPIYEESIDAITGFVHVKDVLEAILREDRPAVASLARPPYFVSESKLVADLLREFQSEHLQVAVVVDEYGGTAGIITIEDIVEEIVGDIADEHEDEEATIVELDEGVYLVSGSLRVELLEELLKAELTGDDYETVAGLIFTTLGRVPSAGTIVKKNGFRFEVDRADRRRIYRVRVSRDPEWNVDEDDLQGPSGSGKGNERLRVERPKPRGDSERLPSSGGQTPGNRLS